MTKDTHQFHRPAPKRASITLPTREIAEASSIALQDAGDARRLAAVRIWVSFPNPTRPQWAANTGIEGHPGVWGDQERRGHCRSGEMMRNAGVYLKDDAYYVESYSMSTAGVWIAAAETRKIATGDAAEIGGAVLDALERSREGVPHPRQDEWEQLLTPLLELAGVKSWNAFARGVKSVGIKQERGMITITAERNLGPKDGFEPMEGAVVRIAAARPPAEIGLALIAAMSKSR